jgi:formylglycine-generating enzyme required for sulfatase activity/tRNA A-37 threonylcarbamoyl transferase component Bud32
MPEPTRIAERYEIIDELGRGGFAVVYKARDTVLDRIVALKVLKAHVAENVTFVQRFEQEARTAARFDHPHIVTVFEVGQEAGHHYIAMNYLPGRGLDEALAEADGPLPLEQVIAIVDQVADALDYTHRRGSVHRDVKPSNVRLSDEGHATLLDFGIVRAADGTRLTTTGETMGTPQYMSPEQAEGQEIDHRSDIYSLGVMAYQMCTGKAPFDDVSPVVVLRLHADKAPPPLHELNPDLPASVEQVLLKALAKEPDERYQSAGDFARALREAGLPQAQAERKRRAEAAALSRPAKARHGLSPRIIAVLSAGGFIVLACLVVGLVVGRRLLWGGAEETPRPAAESPTTSAPTRAPTEMPAPTSRPTREPAGPPAGEFPAGEPWTRPADGMVMVYVPGGTFPMGSGSGDSDEQPVHDVTLDAFWIDQTEVTNAQYVLCVADGDCEESGSADDARYNGDEYPVVSVSWHAAAAYCEWTGARLPTEAEWEYAVRGPEGHRYPWGDHDPTDGLTLYGDPSAQHTAPVGGFPDGASWCRALDMAGNVYEWVADWYGDYPSGPQTNPTGPQTGEERVLRGGSFVVNADRLRGAARSPNPPDTYFQGGGFRCATGPSPEPTASPAPTSAPTREPTDMPSPTSTPTGETAGPPTSEFPAGEPWTRPADGMVMVYVPGGTCTMGSDDDGVDNAIQVCNKYYGKYYGNCEWGLFEGEQPAHDVMLDAFWIDQTEVTNAQFAAFLNDQGNQTGEAIRLDLANEDWLIQQSGSEFQPKSGYADHPVIGISWSGAAAYCKWAGARLPTEAEWEYAARGPERYTFPWGETFDGTRLNFCDANCDQTWGVSEHDDGYKETAPVGSFRSGVSWCGALDMAGNVWEWVADWYGDYPAGLQMNPTGPGNGDSRVLRGGSWFNSPHIVRSAYRPRFAAGYAHTSIGFRCARDS